MTIQRIIELLEIEHECMLRGAHNDCDRNCADCELVQNDGDLHEMYTDVIALLKRQEELLRKLQKDKDKLCLEISEWKHKYHDRPLKEQEADKNKYEYKYDHTDCLWYGSGNCPSTCSQYRDGWNDAMDYIFKDGKGYQPYRRSVNSDE